MEYLKKLNEAQRKAVEHLEGPVMVLAGAGSGKTRVLIYRIVHLMNNKIDPFNILALTFTNKASREMKARIATIYGNTEVQNLWMGTFHSVFAKILRYEAEKIGYPTNFTIYDTDDSKSLIKSILSELQLDDKVYKPGLVYNRISSAKNNLLNAAAYTADSVIQSDDYQSKKPRIGEIYTLYERRCFNAGAMDFDDLLFKTNVLLRDHPAILYKYQDRFKYIMVDEFQDTNFSQYMILKQLAARFENICVVGDDAQSIYAFRGANIQNILNFKRDYPDTVTYKLEQNYRSTKIIVNAANSIISKNTEQLKKEVWTSNDEGAKIKVFKSLTDNEEGYTVASSIFETKLNQQKRNFDFAILYRTNAQSRAMEEALRKRNIPYRVYGGTSFYQRKEIKDLLGYFRLTINPKDEEALKRIINYPARGIGKTTLEKVIVSASENNTSLWNIIEHPTKYNLGINSGAYTKLTEFVTMIKSFAAVIDTENAFDIGSKIAQSSGLLRDLYEDKSPEGLSRYDNIQELLNGLKEFSEKKQKEQEEIAKLPDFMQDIALLTDSDKEEDDNDNDKVSLMTIHAAKGLEFPFVYVVGLEENLFPSQLSLNSRSDLEEERRLFYVAVTRAETAVTLSYALSRYRWGNLTSCEPSRFIEEIDSSFVDIQEPKATAVSSYSLRTYASAKGPQKKSVLAPPSKMPPKRNLVNINQASSNSKVIGDDTSDLQVGMEVRHERFGKGIVEQLEGQNPNKKALINFALGGQKQLLLKFAQLKILS